MQITLNGGRANKQNRKTDWKKMQFVAVFVKNEIVFDGAYQFVKCGRVSTVKLVKKREIQSKRNKMEMWKKKTNNKRNVANSFGGDTWTSLDTFVSTFQWQTILQRNLKMWFTIRFVWKVSKMAKSWSVDVDVYVQK